MTAEHDQSDRNLDDVLALFARYQRRLYAFIASMLPNPAEADEVLQETNIVVWRKCSQFRPGSDFRAWVFQIAYFEVRKFLERRRRQGVSFSLDLLDELSDEYRQQEDTLEKQRELLADCIGKLRPEDRALIEHVYGQGIEVADLAERTGRQKTSLYRSLRRIRMLLLECVEQNRSALGFSES